MLALAGRDKRLAWSLRALSTLEFVGLGYLGTRPSLGGGSVALVFAWMLGGWIMLRLFVPLGSFAFKLALGDWPRATRGSLLRCLRVLALESAWMARLYYWEQPWFSSDPRHVASNSRAPVILVHGFLCNAALWGPLRASDALGDRSVVAVSFEPTYRHFAAQLQALGECVRQTLAVSRNDRVVLVGHSMGGLLIRAFAAEFPERVAGVVCIAAPHHGTWFGNLVFGPENGPPSARAAWLRSFNARTGERIAVAAVNLWTGDDNIVIPARGSRLAHTEEVRLDRLGHMSAIASKAGIKAIQAALLKIDQREL